MACIKRDKENETAKDAKGEERQRRSRKRLVKKIKGLSTQVKRIGGSSRCQ